MRLSNSLTLKTRVSSAFSIGGLSSLVHWFPFNTDQDLNGSNVSSWDDKGSADNDLVQTDASRQPPKNGGELDFSGATTQLLFESDVSLESFTICFALKAGSNNAESILGHLTVGSTVLRLGQGGNAKKIRIQYTDSSVFTHDIEASTDYPTPGTEYVLTITRDTTGAFSTNNQVKTFVNTTEKTSTTFSAAGTSNFIFNKVGSHGAQSNPFDGSIHEIVIFNEALSTSDLNNVVNDIMTRNGIS